MLLAPQTPEEAAALVRSTPRLLAIGARTKPRLSEAPGDVALLSTALLSGIVEYDPGEFTFTALAGTPLRDIAAALAEKEQYLPFDPPLAEAGATIGGTVAAGLAGPGRFRFGGVRDFLLAVRFIDGRGQLLRAGAKVVKNAAGFDLPKFFTGSLGRYGVLVELTFKVFPRPASLLTLRIPCESSASAVERLAAAASARWELDALEYLPDEKHILARLAGPAESNTALAAEIARKFSGTEPLGEAPEVWRRIQSFAWAHPGGLLVKAPLTLATLPALASHEGARTHIGAGGAVAYISLPEPGHSAALSAKLASLGITGLTLAGKGAPLFPGAAHTRQIENDVRRVFDPDGCYG